MSQNKLKGKLGSILNRMKMKTQNYLTLWVVNKSSTWEGNYQIYNLKNEVLKSVISIYTLSNYGEKNK